MPNHAGATEQAARLFAAAVALQETYGWAVVSMSGTDRQQALTSVGSLSDPSPLPRHGQPEGRYS